jgi:hypothetical protein
MLDCKLNIGNALAADARRPILRHVCTSGLQPIRQLIESARRNRCEQGPNAGEVMLGRRR